MEDMIDLDSARMTKARALLEAMPATLYRSLEDAEATAESLAACVSRAIVGRNPRKIRSWISHELGVVDRGHLMTCLDLAIELELRANKHEDKVILMRRMRDEAQAQLQGHVSPETSQTSTIVDSILTTIGAWDERLYRHSIDVATLARRIGGRAHLASDRINLMAHAAKVHEIGRLRVWRAGLLESQDVFDAERRDAVREMLADVRALEHHPGLGEMADLVAGMYSSSALLANDEMQVLRLADDFVSMCEERPYRPKFSPSDAIDMILEQRGERYSATMVRHLADVLGYRRRTARSA